MANSRATASAGTGPLPAPDHLLLAPDQISLDGIYVRQHVDDEELAQLKDSILAGGEVKQAIGVREEGDPESPRFVLVYGMRRWLASRAAGLPAIPVRNHGRISVAESLALQVAENEARVDPHPVDTAVSYHLLVRDGGLSQAEVSRVAGRSAAHVSYMRAVGEAILELGEEERAALYLTPEATVPGFQRIAPLRSLEERVAALRALLADRSGPRPEGRAPAQLRAGPARRGAWSVRLSYRDEDVRRDPELGAQVERFLKEQLERVRQQIQEARRDAARPEGPVSWEME